MNPGGSRKIIFHQQIHLRQNSGTQSQIKSLSGICRGMFKNLKEIELLNCRIEKVQKAMILITPRNGNAHQVFLNQQNAPGLHAERAGGVLYVRNSKYAKDVVRVIENCFCTREIPVRVSSFNSLEEIRYMDPISNVFYRNLNITKSNPLYPKRT